MQTQKSYRWFFILALVYAIFRIGWKISLFGGMLHGFLIIWWLQIASAWFILSLVLLIVFIKNKLPKAYLVLPFYYLLVDGGLFAYIMFFFTFIISLTKTAGNHALFIFHIIIAVITSMFEIGYPIFMLHRKENYSTPNQILTHSTIQPN